jgi:hypothetical protein
MATTLGENLCFILKETKTTFQRTNFYVFLRFKTIVQHEYDER